MRPKSVLVKALARAFRYQRMLEEGRYYASISEMAAAGKIERGYLGSLLRLTRLDPALVEDLVEGRARAAPGFSKLLQPFPKIREYQREVSAQ